MSNFEEDNFDQFTNENDHFDNSYSGRDQSYKRSYNDSHDGNSHGPPKRAKKQGDAEMRCVIPTNVAGGIIGRKGENIKDMRNTFSAQIQLPDGDDYERVLRVRASIESCGEIILRILPIINEENARRGRKGSTGDRNGAGDKSHSLKMLVHQSQAGGIIGMKGFKIKELRETTGAIIKVHQECTPNSTDRACVISGSPEVISSCVIKILQLLEVTPPKGPVHNYDPSERYDDRGYEDDDYYDDFRGGRYGGGGFGERRGWRERDDDYDRSRRGGFGGTGRGGRRGSRGGRSGPRGGGFRGGRGRY